VIDDGACQRVRNRLGTPAHDTLPRRARGIFRISSTSSMELVCTPQIPDKDFHVSECNLLNLSIKKVGLISKKQLIGIQSCGFNDVGTS
jgi:hypothetical protein